MMESLTTTVCARELEAGDVVISAGRRLTVSSAEYSKPMKLIYGPDGTKGALHIRFKEDDRDYFVYPSLLVTLVGRRGPTGKILAISRPLV